MHLHEKIHPRECLSARQLIYLQCPMPDAQMYAQTHVSPTCWNAGRVSAVCIQVDLVELRHLQPSTGAAMLPV